MKKDNEDIILRIMQMILSGKKPIILLHGPSGVGKTTCSNLLKKLFNLATPEAITTRRERLGDNGRYKYVSKEDFEIMIGQGKKGRKILIQHNIYNEYYYGVLKSEFIRIFNGDSNGLVMDMNVVACRQVEENYPSQLIVIALLPDNPIWLLNRLRKRGGLTEEDVKSRHLIALKEIEAIKVGRDLICNIKEEDTIDNVLYKILNIIEQQMKN